MVFCEWHRKDKHVLLKKLQIIDLRNTVAATYKHTAVSIFVKYVIGTEANLAANSHCHIEMNKGNMS